MASAVLRPPGFWSPDLSYVALHRGDVATARDRLGTAIALCEEVGDPITRWLATSWLGEVDAHYEQVLHKGAASDGDLARHSAAPDLASLLRALNDIAGAAAVIDPWVTEFEDELPMISNPFLCAQGDTSTIL